jgi:hypothetical protein
LPAPARAVDTSYAEQGGGRWFCQGTKELEYQRGDHVCAFYNGSGSQLDDIVMDFVTRALNTGNKCICFVDTPSAVQARISPDPSARDGIRQFFAGEEGCLPTGTFSTDAFIESLEATAKGVLSDGYERLWLLGDTSVVARSLIAPLRQQLSGGGTKLRIVIADEDTSRTRRASRSSTCAWSS